MAIGETFLSAFLQVLFEQMLTEGGIQFLKMVGGGVDLPKTIKKWKRQLTALEALLDDAELQQFHSKPVKLWLNDLQDLAYDIEDLLDHFATDALGYRLIKAEEDEANALIDQSNSGILDTMMQNLYASGSRAADSLSTFLKPVDQHIRDKIDDITERLQDIQDQTQSLSLTAAHMMQHQTLQTETLRSHRESTSLVGKVFGRDEKKKEIMRMLLKDDQNAEGYVVIPIVGPGGIGKTTLAQYIYNDEQRYVYRDEQLCAQKDEQQKSNFDLKAWVCVSDVFDVKRVTIDIINSATPDNFGCSNLNQAHEKLRQVLNGKRFLIVLDDIWSQEYANWEKLQIPFQGGAKGSRVIMTTRIDKIAKKTTKNHNNIIRLQGLSDDDCWRLFQHHANEDDSEIKDDIVRKCKGLPLAAKALGGLLKSTTKKSQRRHILESNVWGEECEVLPVLRLSYYHMPSHLKRVFAYCSVFPKDYEFQEMELVLLWMAQGFLPETQNAATMEYMGHMYFNDLVSRSLIEKCPLRPYHHKERFMMHDLIHDVAQLAAGDVCYVMDSKSDDLLHRIRHLFITQHVQTLGNLNLAPQLRTFLCSHDHYFLRVENLGIIQRMHYIRALSLISHQIKDLPDCIGDLKHLRYLSLKFPRIRVLPQSISHLWNLQTLCLNGCLALEMIPQIRSLEKLHHIYNTCIDYSFEEMPLKEMPSGIGKLTNLQTLSRFVLAAGGGSRIRELGMLNHLRERLEISGLEDVTEVADAEEAQLHKKQSLNELHLIWRNCSDEVDDKTAGDVVEKLQPHTCIKECQLTGYMGSTFPSWLGDSSFSNMVKIMLRRCHKCKCLPPLGQLPSLESLWISNMDGIKEVGREFYGHRSTPFPSLSSLQIYYMKSLEKWVLPSVDIDCPSLPSLRKLDINECRQLQSLELKNLSSSASLLETLNVKKCESMVSICNIPLNLHSLEIKDCEKLEYVEFDKQPSMELPLLAKLSIQRCPTLIWLQQNLLLPSLQHLELRDCKIMESVDIGLPGNLKSVDIEDVNIKQAIQEWGLHLLQSLEELELKNVGKSVDSVECIKGPDLCLPSSSSSLEIYDHHSPEAMKLNSVDSVERILCPHLSLPFSLRLLKIKGFQNLKTISNGSNLPNLTRLDVSDCPRLESLVSNFTSLINLSIKDCPEFHNLP